jgi:hypothetical protein
LRAEGGGELNGWVALGFERLLSELFAIVGVEIA